MGQPTRSLAGGSGLFTLDVAGFHIKHACGQTHSGTHWRKHRHACALGSELNRLDDAYSGGIILGQSDGYHHAGIDHADRPAPCSNPPHHTQTRCPRSRSACSVGARSNRNDGSQSHQLHLISFIRFVTHPLSLRSATQSSVMNMLFSSVLHRFWAAAFIFAI